ncbi:conjugal transfer protein TraE [Enterovibrio calviensis]|uniref:VirB4 family type IV secretion/conjugal transfer ATPase n=1 Tax=Enterovibrio calviensis TaxID=91359 RepID=UPI003735C522
MSSNSLKTIPIADSVPKYGKPISREIIHLDDGKLLATIKLSGMPFESETDSSVKNAFDTLTNYFSQLAKRFGSSLAVWSHIVKRKDTLSASYDFGSSEFMTAFSQKYLDGFQGQRFFKTEYFISFVLKYSEFEDGYEQLEDVLKLSNAVLRRYSCQTLSIVEDKEVGYHCENVAFLSYLLNNMDEKTPLTSANVRDVLPKSDWHFGYDLLEMRHHNSDSATFATFFELDGYPATTSCGMWDFILGLQEEFILTQSMIFMSAMKTIKKIDSQINLLDSSGDGSDHQIDELANARGYVSTGEACFGDYHCNVMVINDTAKSAVNSGNELASAFLQRGTVLKRSNLKAPYSLSAMLPNSKNRILPSPRTTRNLTCGFSLHNYSSGKASGNPIGDGTALLPLKTVSDTLFYLNCHASELGKNVTGQKYAGHTMLLGASGTGKTTTEGVLAGFAMRFNPQMFVIDYNRSTELYVRAFGGQYFAITEGQSTGINPFQLRDTPQLRAFLARLVKRMGCDNLGSITETEELQCDKAIETVMSMEMSSRRISMVLQSIPQSPLKDRLAKWCYAAKGSLAWALDAPVNKFDPETMDRIGFDTTFLLNASEDKTHPATEAVLATLFFLKDLMQKEGRLMMTVVEEFWMPANFPLTQSLMKKTLKAGRLKNEFMVLASQSPEDAINCEIFPAIVQQTATKIYLPNPDAEFESYSRCNVTEKEFERLQALSKDSRTFLVKQSNSSAFAKLDLHGFDEYLPIISGSDTEIYACEKVRERVGDDPNVWIPELLIELGIRERKRIDSHEKTTT